jgi:hypothetical protein
VAEIVLSTLNARWVHPSLGLRYLFANMGELASRTALREFVVTTPVRDLLETLLEEDPKVVGFGVYIWNVAATTRLIRMLKLIKPDVVVVAGGPELRGDGLLTEIAELVDFVLVGQADLEFARLCRQVLSNRTPECKILRCSPPDLQTLKSPYPFYERTDIADKFHYIELSRGCPFRCEFCLSSLDEKVVSFPLEETLAEIDDLLSRGAKHLKFVDRTFNLKMATATRVLSFLLQRWKPGRFFHFEMIPDRFPAPLRELVAQFPPGSIQLEVGIQTFNPEVAKAIGRRQDEERVADNLLYLAEHTHAHIHADLIAGLPLEDLDSFASGFDRLYALKPQEIQVGILKLLWEAPIQRHQVSSGMVFDSDPPYEILSHEAMDFHTLQGVRRFARYWDLVSNSGNFRRSLPDVLGSGSAFWGFWEFSNWLFRRLGATHSISLKRLVSAVFDFLTEVREMPRQAAAKLVFEDYAAGGRPDIPACLKEALPSEARARSVQSALRSSPKRQSRHLS